MSLGTVQTQAFNSEVVKAVNVEKSKLFSSLTNKSVTYKNRVIIPPMCMYSSTDGFFNEFHLAHYASFAFKGVTTIIIEATAVEPRDRISPHDVGLWSDEHIAPLKRIVDLIRS
ncbi:hypothetical protein G6F64_013888 [Rhizopus arrhizus]|uniref:NADH:flavin oxidoreductase/NADH oxidase N-terminal domain-containing protein n=1 Tax=Rhizopus oryzae TaxID=64495 RepID=A0A9P6WV40_RHIOR|nr:hypothetical protein G6F64_013888 [Rhizopus arrhizus]